MKNCIICKNEFIPNRNQKLCSDKCKYIRKKIMDKKFLPNKEQRKLYRIKYRKHSTDYVRKYRTNINHKIADYLRNRIWVTLKGKYKSARTLELLGCSIKQLRKHLEHHFQVGMSWNNYGFYGWHIDHIKPCASFNLSKPEEQHKCFHYTNLQPLWAVENWSKHCKY